MNATGTLRVERESEVRGLDVFEHGISADPEYQIASWAIPPGPSAE